MNTMNEIKHKFYHLPNLNGSKNSPALIRRTRRFGMHEISLTNKCVSGLSKENNNHNLHH